MSDKKKKQSLAGKKSWDTRRENERHENQVSFGLKASKTRYKSEINYMEVLAGKYGLDNGSVFHHEGLPDLVAIAPTGKLIFCEIKPKHGSQKRTKLNPQQYQAIATFLKQNYVAEIALVRCSIKSGKPLYEDPIKLTQANLLDYSYR